MDRRKRRLPIVADAIIKRLFSVVMGKLILLENSQNTESEEDIRHYDAECEAATQMKDTIQTIIHRRKTQAFFKLRMGETLGFQRVSKFLSKSHVVQCKTSSGSTPQHFKQQKRKTTQSFVIKTDNREQIDQLIFKIQTSVSNFREKQQKTLKNSCRTQRMYNKLAELKYQFSQLLKCQEEAKSLILSRISINSELSNGAYTKSRWKHSTAAKTIGMKQKLQDISDSQWTLG